VSKSLVIDTGYRPRTGQHELHLKLRRFNILNIHRRWGKSVFAVNAMIDYLIRCENRNPQGVYVGQNYASVKRIIWIYLKEFTERFPGMKANESELLVTIPRPWKGDSIKIQLLGSERYDSLRGIYIDFCCFDEFSYCDEAAWAKIVRPALSDRNGSALLISTPNGRNHFYEIYNRAEKAMLENKDWFAATVRADESGVLSNEELDEIRQTVGEEAYAQEFLCSFFSQVKGAYYKDTIDAIRARGQIKNFPIDVSLETHVAFDLGIGDSTALWFFQLVGKEVHLIDCHEDSGKGLDFYVKLMRDKPYILGEVVLPHDANARELTTGLSRVESLRKMGVSRMRVLPRLGVDDGINAVRMTLPRCFFHEANTARGLECLYSYHKEYNENMQVFVNKPVHDWSSHLSDSFRYLCLSLQALESKSRYNSASLPRVTSSGYDIFGV
jgi:phage terminase large subunit